MVIGLDISKKFIDVAVSGSEQKMAPFRQENSASGYAKLLEWLGSFEIQHIVFESTGGYEMGIGCELINSGYKVYRINPRWIRAFAHCQGKHAKTDAIDAQLIADYANILITDKTPVLIIANLLLDAKIRRRRQLVDIRAQELNRLEFTIGDDRLILQEHIEWLSNHIDLLDKELVEGIKADDQLNDRYESALSVPGIGPVTASILTICMPELGQIDNKSAAALVGVAPMNRDSGQYRGKRVINHGRDQIRRILYMAALSATRTHTEYKTFYQRLIAKGKPGKIAIIAVARKLIVTVNALLRDKRKWQVEPITSYIPPTFERGA